MTERELRALAAQHGGRGGARHRRPPAVRRDPVGDVGGLVLGREQPRGADPPGPGAGRRPQRLRRAPWRRPAAARRRGWRQPRIARRCASSSTAAARRAVGIVARTPAGSGSGWSRWRRASRRSTGWGRRPRSPAPARPARRTATGAARAGPPRCPGTRRAAPPGTAAARSRRCRGTERGEPRRERHLVGEVHGVALALEGEVGARRSAGPRAARAARVSASLRVSAGRSLARLAPLGRAASAAIEPSRGTRAPPPGSSRCSAISPARRPRRP